MSANVEGAFAKLNAKEDAKFISYREVIEKLAECSGDSFSEVATLLKRLRMHDCDVILRDDVEGRLIYDEYGNSLPPLLDHTITNNELEVVFHESGNPIADPDTVGWWRDKFSSELSSRSGIPPIASLDTPSLGATSRVSAIPKTDAELVGKLKQAEQSLADAMHQIATFRQQLRDMQITIDGQRRLIGDQSGIAPHNTHLMKIAIQVQRDYWKNLETPPKQEIVWADLMEKHDLTKAEAQAVERVACPIDRKK